MSKKKKVRIELRKNRAKPARDKDWTRGFQDHGFAEESTRSGERVRAKGDLSRRRTIMHGDTDQPVIDSGCLPGRVLRVHGLHSVVAVEDGRLFRCSVRRLL